MSQQDYKSATINYELPFDVTAGKHKGNPNSRAANLRVKDFRLRTIAEWSFSACLA